MADNSQDSRPEGEAIDQERNLHANDDLDQPRE
jgi:hypothetical protein